MMSRGRSSPGWTRGIPGTGITVIVFWRIRPVKIASHVSHRAFAPARDVPHGWPGLQLALAQDETVIAYKPEFITGRNGQPVRFRYDRQRDEFARDGQGELIPDAVHDRVYVVTLVKDEKGVAECVSAAELRYGER